MNEPQVRAFAFCSEAISWEDHLDWFRKRQSDPGCTILILTDGKDFPVGQVRFDMESDKTAEIAISIAPEQRGCGYGVEAVRLACDYLRRQRPVTRIVAYIKPHNNASQGTFKKAGFLFQGQKKVKENEAVVMTLEVDST